MLTVTIDQFVPASYKPVEHTLDDADMVVIRHAVQAGALIFPVRYLRERYAPMDLKTAKDLYRAAKEKLLAGDARIAAAYQSASLVDLFKASAGIE
jgi:hypothetical protein